MACVRLDAGSLVVMLFEEIKDLFIQADPFLIAFHSEDRLEVRLRRMAYVDLVAYPPEEGLIHQTFGFHICAEDKQFVEGDLKLHAGVQGHEVYPPLQRNNPPVQEHFRLYLLPPKIVDNKKAVIGLHLEGGQVKPGNAVEFKIKGLQGKFPAGNDDRPFYENPPFVDEIAVDLELGGNMVDRVKDTNNFSPHDNGMGGINGLGEGLSDRLGNAGFSVA